MKAGIVEVTERIRERSAASRRDYLGGIDAMLARPRGPERLGCANLAHATAALPAVDKLRIVAERAPNIGVVTAYNDTEYAGVRGEQVPGGIGLLGQGHIARRVIAEPDDPGMVLAGPPLVAQCELLEPDDRRPPPGRRPGRGTAERAESDDDDVAVGCRGLGQRISPISGPYQRRMSALSSSMGANQPWV